MELLPLVCLCLLSCSGDAVRVLVEPGSDAVLPCLISTEDLEGNKFDWKKDDQKEVFMYDAGIHYNNGRPGQDEQFKGRVSHFQDQLQNGNASIKITRTKMADSGTYRCDFPRLQSQTFYIELVVAVRVEVREGSDAVLPCLISTEDLRGKLFDWKKDGQKEVFMYDAGNHYNNGRTGQDEQFKGRVSHFQDQLMNGNASIKIHETKMADSGNYSCDFPRLHPRQTFIIELVVDPVLRDRTGEVSGAAPEPCIRTLNETKFWRLLQCEAHGVPRPTLKWEDSDDNILPAEDPHISERRGRSYVTVKTTVTKTDNYHCVATQETLSHQVAAVTSVFIQDAAAVQGPPIKWIIAGVVSILLVVGGGWCYKKKKDEETQQLKQQLSSLKQGDMAGNQRWMADRLEGHIPCEGIQPTFLTGLAALFSTFNTFNLQYQEEAACTLEFIQSSGVNSAKARRFIGINPERGSKNGRGKVVSKKTGKVTTKESTTVNPHVSTLLKRLMDFEWDFI